MEIQGKANLPESLSMKLLTVPILMSELLENKAVIKARVARRTNKI